MMEIFGIQFGIEPRVRQKVLDFFRNSMAIRFGFCDGELDSAQRVNCYVCVHVYVTYSAVM